jgi:hypothetical protein
MSENHIFSIKMSLDMETLNVIFAYVYVFCHAGCVDQCFGFCLLSNRKGKPEQKTEIETQEQTMPLTLETQS